MNAHFSNAVNSVAFTWGTQKTYHAAQFGEAQFNDHEFFGYGGQPRLREYGPLGLKATDPQVTNRRLLGKFPGGPGFGEVLGDLARQRRLNARLVANDAPGGPVDMSPFWGGHSEPFEGDETGPPVWTIEDEMRHRYWDDEDEEAMNELRAMFPDSGGPTWQEMEGAEAPGRPEVAKHWQIAMGNLPERHALRMRRYR